MSGVLDAVQQHVHAADAQHGGVEVEAVEQVVVEVLAQLRDCGRASGWCCAQILARRPPGSPPCRRPGRRPCPSAWRGQLDHQLDDVARRAELAVLPGGGDLAEHVLVDVALGVAVLHLQAVDHVDDLGRAAPASGW